MATNDSGNEPNFLSMLARLPLSMYSKMMLRNWSVSMQSIYLTMFSCLSFLSR
jgi:hypothetical protein